MSSELQVNMDVVGGDECPDICDGALLRRVTRDLTWLWHLEYPYTACCRKVKCDCVIYVFNKVLAVWGWGNDKVQSTAGPSFPELCVGILDRYVRPVVRPTYSPGPGSYFDFSGDTPLQNGLEVRDRIGNAVKSAGIPRNGRPGHPALPQRIKQLIPTAHATKKSVPAGGHRFRVCQYTLLGGVPAVVSVSQVCRCGSCASSLAAPPRPTPEFADAERTGPLLPSWVVKAERFKTTRSMLHKLHKVIDWTREWFSVYTLERRTRGWSAPD
ncbi:hypothetical protein EDB84DRAFT_1434949 [Lactarius hengduanensis]|nr:hypothetical protein EDB84DRAFT_1434949 [Lactarius hengduanensis]